MKERLFKIIHFSFKFPADCKHMGKPETNKEQKQKNRKAYHRDNEFIILIH